MKIFLNILRDLFIQLLPKKFVKYFIKPGIFIWLVHPRDTNDIIKKISVLRYFPEYFISGINNFLWPFIVSGFSSKQNQIAGYIIGVPLIPKQILSNPKMAIRKTRQGLEFAEKLGAKYISLGGFLPSIVYKNEFDKKFNMDFFDGTNLLARLVLKKIQNISKEYNLETKKITFGIIGATTKTGNIITKLIIRQNVLKINLFGKTQEHLNNLKRECLEISKEVNIETFTNLNALIECDFVILTAYLSKELEVTKYLKKGSVFFSAIEPISPFVHELKKLRKDIKVILGITISTPGVNYENYDFGLPSENSFACVTEALILINNKAVNHSFFTDQTKESIKSVENLLDKYGFSENYEKK